VHALFKNYGKILMVELVGINHDESSAPPAPPVPDPRMVNKKNEESKVDMEFSTPLQDVMGAEFDDEIIQDQAPQRESYMRRPEVAKEAKPVEKVATADVSSKNPFGLTDDQMQAGVAGIAAVVAFSPQVQEKVQQFLPQVSGTPMGSVLMVLVAAIIFMIIKRFTTGKTSS
jgi:hypothetical protein